MSLSMKFFLYLNGTPRRTFVSTVFGYRGLTLRDCLERLPREWISEELMEALENKGVHLSSTLYAFCFYLLD